MRNRLLIVLLLVLVSGSGASVGYAQVAAQITGIITDPSGAIVPGVAVTVTKEETGAKWQAKSNGAGLYTVPFLQPGNYRIDIVAQGFKAENRAGIVLEVAQTATVNFKLQLGSTATSVDVTDTAPLLNTGSGAMGGTVTPKEIEDLPLLGRNSNALMMLEPGVRVTRDTVDNPVVETHYQFFSVNGSRPSSSQFFLDGANDSDLGFNGPEYSPQVEELQEYKVQTSSFSAEYGLTAGGVVQFATKSGTNTLHGSVFEYDRNDKFSAANFFTNLAGAKTPPLKYNQFGGAVGGPIKKDRLFFFFAYEGLRELQSTNAIFSTQVGSVPTAAERLGDFSGLLNSAGQPVTLYNPWSTRPDPNNPGQYVRDPIPGNNVNNIPGHPMDPVALAFTHQYPLPNTTPSDPSGLNNYTTGIPTKFVVNNFSGRVDYQLNSRTQLMGRYSRENLPVKQIPDLFGFSNKAYDSAGEPQHHPFAMGKLTKVFSPNLFGDFLFSWARFYIYIWDNSSYPPGTGVDPTTFGFPQSLAAANSGCQGLPYVQPGEMYPMGGNGCFFEVQDRLEGKADLSWLHGKHTLKFGGMWGDGRFYNNITEGPALISDRTFTQGPNPFVSSATAGFGYASFMLGTMTTGSSAEFAYAQAKYNEPYYGLYLQDDFKVMPNLTVNLGIRWDFESPRTEQLGRISNFSFTGTSTLSNGTVTTGGLEFPGLGGLGAGTWNPTYKNFGPRVGLAYNVSPSTVIRGGYGMFFANSWGSGQNGNSLPQTGFVCTTTSPTTLDGGLTPYATLSNPFPQGFCTPTGSTQGLQTNLGQQLLILQRNQLLPYMQTWNLNVQRTLPGNMVAEVAYSGSRGSHLLGTFDYDQLNPKYLPLGASLSNQVPNPYYGVITTGPLASPTIAVGQSLLPYPQFLGVESTNDTYGWSLYNALFVRVERRFSKGFSIVGSYTLSKELDDIIPSNTTFPGETFAYGYLQNYYNLKGEKALAVFDTPQTLVLSSVYELPVGPGKPFLNQRGALGKILGGWEINGIAEFQSGHPLQISGGNSGDYFGAITFTQRPDWTGKSATLNTPVIRRLNESFDTSQFSYNAPFTFGNAPRVMPNLRGPGSNVFDFSIFKNTKLTERLQLQFRAEAFNLFNRVQFGDPDTVINDTTFGVIASQQNLPRNIQLGMRLVF